MLSRGIRGATTVDFNTEDAIKSATIELLEKILQENNIDKISISHVIFTLTSDINAGFPAKFARIDLGFDEVPMMCFNELPVENSLKMCLRILVVANVDEKFKAKFVYLKGAKNLRK